MSDTRRTALIAIDWGTTSARAYRLDAAGDVCATRSAPLGIKAIQDGQFRAALDALLEDWRDDAAPRIACGMIGSRQGWIEAPYVACPADLAGLGRTLTATPDGGLLIGFRNPIPQGKALVVPLLNPKDVVMGLAKAKLGAPILLSLAGLGIRSIEYSAARNEYLIVAGPDGVTGPFHLYRWTGSKSEAPIEVTGVSFTGLQPEALIVYPDNANTIEILSDDGARDIHGVPCKNLPVDQRVFRSLRVSF